MDVSARYEASPECAHYSIAATTCPLQGRADLAISRARIVSVRVFFSDTWGRCRRGLLLAGYQGLKGVSDADADAAEPLFLIGLIVVGLLGGALVLRRWR
jgi:hypothetical protein